LQAKPAPQAIGFGPHAPPVQIWSVSVDCVDVAAQEAAPHAVPLTTSQLPAPLQLSALHAATPAVQSFFGSLPTAALTHAARAGFTTSHAGQLATALQSFPFCPPMHCPDTHSFALAQPAPFASLASQVPGFPLQ
jgi:hypothetical protein